MSHAFYIGMSYGLTGLIVAILIGWITLDGRARKREMAELEASGIRRRSRTASVEQPTP
ncbi:MULTISPECIES: heme exporter protein CcmD [Agrobacterium]|uniref:Heme exporter protein D n=1 Tax=Agrobacterium rosae TaxID=1972867 RepID=A0A1R3TVF0_9HYPH|nr:MULTISPECIES: heme exporter protein CcmD [Agrobacterium]MDX8304860.1 heme exporter protein CcmD [Agrobacterium rosae]POO54602.1 heme exporter protein CcmD [Agrobacterium rosae]SCX17548.1 heme exporter protein CcmD [Agrobacterium sp. DSM 25558]SCX29831.1 heme exporter protein CcmD [Agrobacterium rosae]